MKICVIPDIHGGSAWREVVHREIQTNWLSLDFSPYALEMNDYSGICYLPVGEHRIIFCDTKLKTSSSIQRQWKRQSVKYINDPIVPTNLV
ncbi:hypothetical protein [Porphyromonas gulae]|uniref:Uncharacterized protein n=1 Tax=Porphyromonas gulae TaxID=111105 RepID=A0A0A2F2H5_9PORP|nr:hypothetical protein [Porphyromonas gulae]KGN84235.1 hypothetical protein HR15_11220 [Porphyromonas gulae]